MVAYEVGASGAFFAAILADRFAYFIASAAFIFAFAMIVKTVAAVVTHFMIVIAGTTVAAVMLLIAVTVGTLAAVVAVVTFPIVVTPAAAVFALHAVFVSGRDGKCHTAKKQRGGILDKLQKVGVLFMRLMLIMIVMPVTVPVCMLIMIVMPVAVLVCMLIMGVNMRIRIHDRQYAKQQKGAEKKA